MLLEVLDKVPTATAHLVTGGLLGATGLVACLRWPKALWLLLPATALVAWSEVALYADPSVGPALWHEAGPPYAAAVIASTLLLLGLPLLGAWLTLTHSRPGQGPRSTHPPGRPSTTDLERSRHRVNLFLDLVDWATTLFLPPWLWLPGSLDDDRRRFSAALVLVLMTVGILILFGAWLTGSIPR